LSLTPFPLALPCVLPQRISLTSDQVLISKVDDPGRIFDFINLDEVVECELKGDSADDSHARTSNGEMGRSLRVATRNFFVKSALHSEFAWEVY